MNTLQNQGINTQASYTAEQCIAAVLAVIVGALSTYIVSILVFQLLA